MSGFAFSAEGDHGTGDGFRHSETDSRSKEVMLRAEVKDEIEVNRIEHRFSEGANVPEDLIVRQRTNTYYGPKLRVVSRSGREFLITAPGPDSQLLLWEADLNEEGNQVAWVKLAEVSAVLRNDSGGYHLCQQCNEPLKTAEHQRMAAIGHCPNVN